MLGVLRWVGSGLAALGAGLLVWLLMVFLAHVARVAWTLWAPAWVRVMRAREAVLEQAKRHRRRWAGGDWRWLAAGIVLAVLAMDPILSAGFLMVGIVLWIWSVSWQRRRAMLRQGDQVLELLRRFQAFFRGSLSQALVGVLDGFPPGEIREGLQRMCQKFYLGYRASQAAMEMVGINPVVDQMAWLIASATAMDVRTVLDMVGDLERGILARREMLGRIGVEMTLVSAVTYFLAAFGLAVLVLVLLVPGWREFYVSSFSQRVVMLAAVAIMAAGLVYFFEQKLRAEAEW